MFVLILGEVISRYVFNSPTTWANELTQLIFGVYSMVSGGFILRSKGHVNVDILYLRLSAKGRAFADVVTFFIFFMFCSMMVVYGGFLAWESLSAFEHSESAWSPPLYPIKLTIPLGAFLLLLQGIVKFIRDIQILFSVVDGRDDEVSERETL